MRYITFIEVDIHQRMAPVCILYTVTLTFISRTNIFLLCICYKNNAQTANVPGRVASTLTAHRRGVVQCSYRQNAMHEVIN